MFGIMKLALGSLVAALASGALFGVTSTGPRPDRGRQRPQKATRGGRLLWDSNRFGAAYRLHDAKGNLIYVPLKSVPPKSRLPRRARKSGAVVAEVRARA